jgi:hypothetical protein
MGGGPEVVVVVVVVEEAGDTSAIAVTPAPAPSSLSTTLSSGVVPRALKGMERHCGESSTLASNMLV